jgi:hypothetical protein
MFTLIFSGYGLLTLNQLPQGQNMNSQYFCDVVLEETREALTSIPEKSGIEGMMIHLDNCRVHNSGRTTLQFQDSQVTRLPHPTCSPDISPCDVWFFGWSKGQMRGHEFHGADEVRSFLLNLWKNLDQNSIISVFWDVRDQIDHAERRIGLKLLFVKGRRYRVTWAELCSALGEQAHSLLQMKRWIHHFEEGELSWKTITGQGDDSQNFQEEFAGTLTSTP